MDLNALIDQQMGAAAPQQAQQTGLKSPAFARLAALIPIAMAKGGRAGVAGLIQGYQQGLARKQQMAQQQQSLGFNQQRAMAQDAMAERRLGMDEQTLALRQQQMAAEQQERQRAQFLEQAAALGAIDQSPEAAMQALSGLAPQASALGVPQVALESQFAVTPSAREMRQLRGAVARVDAEMKGKADQDSIEDMTINLPTGKQVKVRDARAILSGATGAPKPAPSSVGNSDFSRSLARYAAKIGKKPEDLTFDEEQAARKAIEAVTPPRVQQYTGDLPPRTQARVNQLSDAFRKDPAVVRANTIAESLNFVRSLSDTTTNPGDDQALVYAFAKAMDPESVVREGEYATVQKYAQSWLSAFKFDAMRVLNESQFLTPQARQQLKATIATRFQASKTSYDNVRREYAKQIDRETKAGDGLDRLVDYAAMMPTATGSGAAPSALPTSGSAYERYKARGGK